MADQRATVDVPSTKKKLAYISYNGPEEGQPFVIQWELGNGTSYRLLFTPMSGHLVGTSGFDFGGGRGYMVSGSSRARRATATPSPPKVGTCITPTSRRSSVASAGRLSTHQS